MASTAASASVPTDAEATDAQNAAAAIFWVDQPLLVLRTKVAACLIMMLPSPWPLRASSSIFVHSGVLTLQGQHSVAGGTDRERVQSTALSLSHLSLLLLVRPGI